MDEHHWKPEAEKQEPSSTWQPPPAAPTVPPAGAVAPDASDAPTLSTPQLSSPQSSAPPQSTQPPSHTFPQSQPFPQNQQFPQSPPFPQNASGPWQVPYPTPAPPRRFPRWWIYAGIGLCVVLAGVVWLVWPDSSKPTDRVVAGTVQATVLSADDVSKLAGTTLVAAATTNQPPAALAADQAGCAVAVGPATQAVYGHDWTGFLSVTYQDLARKGSMTVTQVAAVFPSADKASAAFKTLHDGLTGCSSAVVTDHGGRASQWQYKVDAQSDTSVGWTATEPSGGAWSCHHQAQLTGTSLLQVSVCSAGDGGTVASKVADKFAAQVKAS